MTKNGKATDECRRKEIRFRILNIEKEFYARQALAAGITLTEFMRKRMLDEPILNVVDTRIVNIIGTIQNQLQKIVGLMKHMGNLNPAYSRITGEGLKIIYHSLGSIEMLFRQSSILFPGTGEHTEKKAVLTSMDSKKEKRSYVNVDQLKEFEINSKRAYVCNVAFSESEYYYLKNFLGTEYGTLSDLARKKLAGYRISESGDIDFLESLKTILDRLIIFGREFKKTYPVRNQLYSEECAVLLKKILDSGTEIDRDFSSLILTRRKRDEMKNDMRDSPRT